MDKQQRPKWTPVIVSNRNLWNEGETQVSLADEGPAFLALQPPYVDGSLEDTTKVLDQRRADLCFALGVALALGLPAAMGLGVYVAAKSIILIAG